MGMRRYRALQTRRAENGAIIVADTSNYVIRLLKPADARRRIVRP